MATFQQAIQEVALQPDYAYLARRPSLLNRIFKKLFEFYCHTLFTIYCPLKISGRQNLPDSAFLFCSNHCSHLDSGVLLLSSGLPFKKCGMIAAKEYFFENKTRRSALNLLMNLIPIDRKITHNELLQCLAACKHFVQNGGRNLIFYPEGTRSRTGQMQKFKLGPALFATELQLPIVPAYINGTFEAWPKGRVLMKPTKLHALIGDPIYPQQLTENDNAVSKKRIYRKIAAELETSVHALRNRYFEQRGNR